MTLILEILRKLEMCDRVRCDQIFESIQILEKVLSHDEVGARVLRTPDVIEDPLEDFEQECTGATGEVEHGDTLVVSQAIADTKTLLQNVIYRADDEVYDWRRRVVNPRALRVAAS